ncbi:MAG TPA: cupin domain-containing protein [Steroidobacteraceae bacterium]|nr:cupin domain-containing protein [Steroidobacteraceae bacterium]HUA23658.1 cupin domain-containing protein [Steroidobacteraceae bacterium]
MSHTPQTILGAHRHTDHQPDEGGLRVIHSEDIVWRPFPAFPPAARLAVLVGDPTRPGPYLIRVKLPAGTRMLPHSHPEDRIYTVISGVFYIGLGEEFDESKLSANAPGTVLVLPGGQPHFHWAKSGEYVTQVSAIGPLGLAYVDQLDDPRNHGDGRPLRPPGGPRARG